MTRKVFALVILVAMSVSAVAAEQWDKYIPEKDRKQAARGTAKFVSSGGFGANERALVSWVTDRLARAAVSSLVDRQRLLSADADRKYQELRPGDRYTFIIRVWFAAEHLRPLGPHKTRDLVNPLDGTTMFLQRADDNSNFARGTAVQTQFDLYDGLADYNSSYLVAIQKKNDAGSPVIKTLDDIVELQFEIAGKKTKAKYSLKDIASSSEDL